MVTKKFGVDFKSEGGALTLNTWEVTNEAEPKSGVEYSRTHPDGWTIKGVIREDYFQWVNTFSAYHSRFGRVSGNFETTVEAESEEAFRNFYGHHQPRAWDYADI